jgi:cyclophilin family peptidyl-prolyl cis-trans isomerase
MQRTRIALLASFTLLSAAPLAVFSQAPAAPAAAPAPAASACVTKGNAPVRVKLTTSMGPIVLELNKEKAPISTENFVKYVESGHYNNTVFHRVIDAFMIQGGGFSKDYAQKPTNPPIKNESTNGLKNDAYTISMARTQVRDSATSQFFINSNNNGMLDFVDDFKPGYAVFGRVVEGRDTVDKIRKVKVQPSRVSEAQPLEPVVLEKAECVPSAS